jgi:aminotransferase
LRLPESYYHELSEKYLARRDRMLAGLELAGFRCFQPHGAYYIMADISGFGFANDVMFARYLVEEIGVGVVPGSSFYRDPASGAQQVRFTYCKKDVTLDEALRRLEKLRSKG